MKMKGMGSCPLRSIMILGVLLVLSRPLFVNSIAVADAAGTTVAYSNLNDPDWMPDHCTAVQLERLLAQWWKREQRVEASLESVKSLYDRLGHKSYDVRQAASGELAGLGADNLESLQRLSKGGDDPERTIRARQIIARWRKDREKKPVRVRNIFRVWKISSHDQQRKYAKQLVKAIQKLPAEVSGPDQRPASGRRLRRLVSPQWTIQFHARLLPEIASQLRSHESPEANLILMSFLRENNTILVLRTMQLIGSPQRGLDVAPELVRLAEGKNKTVALRALSHLSNWHGGGEHRGEITAMLKRLYASKDEEVALQAAIISCYAGDWSGFSRLLDATKSPNKTVALKAIGQLVDGRYRRRAEQVVPLLIPHLRTDDLKLLSRTIQTLGSYPGTAEYILPFLQHTDKHIVRRTILALNRMEATEAIVPLKELRRTTTDKAAWGYIDNALPRLEKIRKKQ